MEENDNAAQSIHPKKGTKKAIPKTYRIWRCNQKNICYYFCKKTVSCRIKNRRNPFWCDGTFIYLILLFFSFFISFVQQISPLNWEICPYLLHFIIPIQAWAKGNILCPLIWVDPPIPLVPPYCTISKRCFLFFVLLLTDQRFKHILYSLSMYLFSVFNFSSYQNSKIIYYHITTLYNYQFVTY